MRVVRSRSSDVFDNLALEEHLLDHAPELPLLYLYVNDPCVVIGKNQNPWRECRLSEMEADGVALARRISGGGAVYHDQGNLNVSVIVERTEYVEQKQYDLIFRALAALVSSPPRWSRLGKSSLGIGGRKFSGQAFCHRGGRTLHHGTLLIDADLSRLGRYLGPELDGIQTHAVASEPAPVINLSALAPALSVEALSASLIETFGALYGTSQCGAELAPDFAALARLRRARSAREWTLGQSPKFEWQGLQVVRGRVKNRPGERLFWEWLSDVRGT